MKLNEIQSEIDLLCKKYHIPDYTINDDGSVDAKGYVIFNNERFSTIPIKFRKVTGNFVVRMCSITSTENFPKEVTGGLVLNSCRLLKSLKGCTPEVGSGFACILGVKIKSLEGCPTNVGGDFDINSCINLTSLKGCPDKVNDFNVSGCTSLTSLDDCPDEIIGTVNCDGCTSLTSISALKYVLRRLVLEKCLNCFNILPTIFKLRKKNKAFLPLTGNAKLDEILRKWLLTGDLVGCQDELMDIPELEKYAE